MARIGPILRAEKEGARQISTSVFLQNQEPLSEPVKAINLTRRRKWGESIVKRWEEVIRDIAKEGFLRRDDVSKSFAEHLTDPVFVNPPARLYTIGGVSPEHQGSIKFSTIDFFGKEPSQTWFIVINEEKFRVWETACLEVMFRAKNPHPDRHLAAAFTRYMHDRNLHWTGCTERRINCFITDDVVSE